MHIYIELGGFVCTQKKVTPSRILSESPIFYAFCEAKFLENMPLKACLKDRFDLNYFNVFLENYKLDGIDF